MAGDITMWTAASTTHASEASQIIMIVILAAMQRDRRAFAPFHAQIHPFQFTVARFYAGFSGNGSF